MGFVKKLAAQARAASAFATLYFIPTQKHKVPDSPRLEPAY